MKKQTSYVVTLLLGLCASPSFAYQVWMGTHLMQSTMASNLGDWDLTASLLDGVNINRAPHDTNPASNSDWQTILGQVSHVKNTMTEIARSEVSRNPAVIDDNAINQIADELQQKFTAANNFGYDIDHIMFYDNRTTYQGTEYDYNWTETEAQHMRDWLDNNGHSEVNLIWNARNNSQANRNWSENTLVNHVMIEASANSLLTNANNQITLLNWLWTNPNTINKDIILQIPRSNNSMTQYASTRRVAVMLGNEIGYENGMQSDRLVFLPVTYNDNYAYLPETTSGGNAYTNSLTSLTLSLIEQRPLFEGIGGIPTNADADSFVRNVMEPDFGPLIAGWETWSEVSADTWDATQITGVTAQAVGTPEAGGVWFNFNNATVENGASSDGQYGNLGPTGADTSVAAPTDGVTLSNGFDGFIDFILTDTTGTDRTLTGFHFDLGAFRTNAATDWELSVLTGSDITVGSLATGTATVLAGPMQDDESIDLTGLADNTLDANGSVTFRLNFTGGGAPETTSSGHHLFLDNVGVTGLTLGVSGDYDGDGDVDGTDFLEWQRNDGTPAGLAAWQSNYGAPTMLSASSATVPEPSAGVLVVSGMVLSLIRKCRASTVCALIVLVAFHSAHQATAQISVSPLFDMSPDSNALVLATGGSFSNVINGSPFQQESLITHEGYQYATWYHNGTNQDIYIARRSLTGNTWETIDTGFDMVNGNQNWDSHNVISMGISGDGRIHLAFDHHVDGLRYVTTNSGVATSSGGVWNSSIFNAERDSLNLGGSSIPRVTYPRFTNVGDDLVLSYRDYGSGNGDHRIADYNSQTGQWSSTRFVTKGRSTGQIYDDVNNNPSNSRNSYHNGFHADSTGRLHTTWTWREGTQDGNHDIMYAYSDDKGVTWRNNNNVQVGTNASPITLNSPGIEVVDLDRRHALLNQQGQIVDAEGGVHVLMFHRPKGPTYTNSPFSDASNSDYHHYYRNPLTGIWDVNQFPSGIAVGSRPRIGVDSAGHLFGVYTQSRDLVIVGAEKTMGGYADWEVLYREQTRNYDGTPLLDTKRLFDEGILSIFVQEEPTSTSPTDPTGSPLHIIEFNTHVPGPPVMPGTLIAGWDMFSGGGSSPVSASVTTAGVTASFVTTTEGLAWHTNDGRGASADGDWGAFAGPPIASTIAGDGVTNENLELPNATTGGTITFTITNNGATDIELDSFHFDAYAFRPKAARTYELSVSSGDITNGVIYTSALNEITEVGGAWDNNAHDDIDHSLSGLADNILEVGGTASFLLAFSGGAGDGSGGHDLWVDNIAITAVVNAIPGDFDGDGDVDGNDFLVWQRTDGTPAGLAAWQSNYGAPTLLSASSAAVPEPNCLIFMLLGASCFKRFRL